MQRNIMDFRISRMVFVFEERTFIGRNTHLYHGNVGENGERVTFPWHLSIDFEYTYRGRLERCTCVCGRDTIGIVEQTTLVSWGSKATIAREIVGAASRWAISMRLAWVMSTIFTGASIPFIRNGPFVTRPRPFEMMFRNMWDLSRKGQTVIKSITHVRVLIDPAERNPLRAIRGVRSANYQAPRPQPPIMGGNVQAL